MGNSREVMQMQNPNNIVLHLPQIINVFVKRRHDDCSICTAVTAICRWKFGALQTVGGMLASCAHDNAKDFIGEPQSTTTTFQTRWSRWTSWVKWNRSITALPYLSYRVLPIITNWLFIFPFLLSIHCYRAYPSETFSGGRGRSLGAHADLHAHPREREARSQGIPDSF